MTIYNVLEMAAGLAFFLFGMNVMSSNLERMAGGKLELILKKMTANPLVSIFLGALITIAVQSSSATTVMLVGLVNSGLMTFASTISVIFGANIGTTLTAWITAFSVAETENFFVSMLKPENFSPILAIIGIAFIMVSKSDKKKAVGSVFVGFTVLIYGMKFMAGSVSGLEGSEEFSKILVTFNNPFVGVLIGTAVTAVIQSSAASISVLQALSLTGGITYTMAIPIVLGQNIGTCATGLISCIGTNAKAKRVAVVHTLIKIIGTAVLLPLFYLVMYFFNSAFLDKAVDPVKIAIIHTVFNILNVAVLFPFKKPLVKLTEKLIPDKKKGKEKEKRAFYLDERLLRSPSVAISECDNFTFKMAELAKTTVLNSMQLIFGYDKALSKTVHESEDMLDLYEDELGTYLVKLSAEALSKYDSQKISRMLHTIGDFERLGDHALNLDKCAKEIHDKEIVFSNEAKAEINTLIKAVTEIIEMTSAAYRENDVKKAVRVEPLEQVIDNMIYNIKSNHIERLQHGNCTIEMGFVLSDLLTNCERISDHCSNIAVAVIEVGHDTFDTHKYLNGVKYGNSEFNAVYDEFKKKYAI